MDSWCEDDGFVCYESQMLREWAAYAGAVQQGPRRGEPLKMKKIQRNSLCILTTRFPETQEEDRLIFGVFLVDELEEGDELSEGFVKTNSKFKIELTPKEAKVMNFWNYYANGENPEKPRWGQGLFRYLDDEIAAQILRDIVEIKTSKKDKAFAEEFFEHYCQVNNIALDAIGEPEGALCIRE